MVMAMINIVAFFICLGMLSYLWKESIVEVFPYLVCVLVLTLYLLALAHHLSLIDGIGIVIVTVFLIWLIVGKRETKKAFRDTCLREMTHPSFITAVFLLLFVLFCTSQKVVSWWDDVNFWATDVKALYYLDGFARRYGNVAPEFGDYPPAGQLMKWWFLHLDPGEFREGLAFAGYYVMNLAFMLPLLRHLKGKNILMFAFFAGALWFLPSIAEVYGYEGFCADLTMACIYGGFLSAVTRREGKADAFYYSRLALYLSVLVLVKSVGFIWAVFGLLFYLFCQRMDKNRLPKRRFLQLAVFAAPAVTGASWMLFCLLMRRVTKTTATAVKYMTTDEYGISGYTADYARAFWQAFIGSPLHKEKSFLLDLTPLGFYLCICLLVVFFYRKNIIPRKQGKLVLWYSVISGALFYGIIFVAHITIFATETQYLEASGMISSMERYGAPFTIGTLLFLADLWLAHGSRLFTQEKMPVFLRQYGNILCFLLFVALTAGYRSGYHGLIGYREDISGTLAEREAMIDAEALSFLHAIEILGTKESARVCCLQRADEPRWVKNSYTNLYASPISVVYQSINLETAAADWLAGEIRSSHASYLYVETAAPEAAEVLKGMTEDGEFEFATLYYILDDGIQLRLQRL